MTRTRIAISTVAAAACLAVPAGSAQAATTTTTQPPLLGCVVEVVKLVPGFAVYTVDNFVQNGELPRIMGPFLPC